MSRRTSKNLGLLKFDFLGLSNLTILMNCRKFIQQTRGIDIDLDRLPVDDARTYALLGDGRDDRRLPVGVGRDALLHQGAEADLHGGYHGDGRALSPRPDGLDPAVHPRQARRGRDPLSRTRCSNHCCANRTASSSTRIRCC